TTCRAKGASTSLMAPTSTKGPSSATCSATTPTWPTSRTATSPQRVAPLSSTSTRSATTCRWPTASPSDGTSKERPRLRPARPRRRQPMDIAGRATALRNLERGTTLPISADQARSDLSGDIASLISTYLAGNLLITGIGPQDVRPTTVVYAGSVQFLGQ